MKPSTKPKTFARWLETVTGARSRRYEQTLRERRWNLMARVEGALREAILTEPCKYRRASLCDRLWKVRLDMWVMSEEYR